MQNEDQPSENLNVSGGEVQENSFDGNLAPIVNSSSGPVIFNYYSNDSKVLPNGSIGIIKGESANTFGLQEGGIGNGQSTTLKEKLDNLLVQKEELEKRLGNIESEISQIRSVLISETNPSLTTLLHWLSGRSELAEKYGKIALRGFQILRQEAEKKGDLGDFYFEVENYLELISLSLEKDDRIFLQEPPIPPSFADPDIYGNASSDIYREVFRILKENIPRNNVESSLRSKLEGHFDELLERLQAYF